MIDWYDDKPQYQGLEERQSAMFSQLNPVEEWLNDDEIDQLKIDIFPMKFIPPLESDE